MKTFLAALALVSLTSGAGADDMAEVVTPAEPIRILEQPREAFRFHIAPHTAVDPALTAEDIFQLDGKGKLTITGQTWGYLRTAKRYRDYHLVLEYRFTGPTSGTRAAKARDSGLLLHCFGRDGSRSKTWLPCIEVQIMEGATGDFIVLGPFDDDKNLLPLHLESTGKSDGQKVPFHAPEGETIVLPQNRPLGNAIHSLSRNRNYREVKDWHSETDADFATGEDGKWNRLDVVCDGDEIVVHVNGRLVNRGRKVSPTVGFLAIQSEGATVEYRNWVLHPLGTVEIPASQAAPPQSPAKP